MASMPIGVWGYVVKMNANELLHYLRGFFELVGSPTQEQIWAIRNEVLRAKPVEAELIPVEVVNPMKRAGKSDCGCGQKGRSE